MSLSLGINALLDLFQIQEEILIIIKVLTTVFDERTFMLVGVISCPNTPPTQLQGALPIQNTVSMLQTLKGTLHHDRGS